MRARGTLLSFMVIVLLFVYGCENSGNQVGAQEEEVYTLTITTNVSTTHPFSKETIVPYMERVTELTDGQVQFKYYPSEQLGKSQDFIHLVRDGVIDIAHFNAYSYPSEFPITSSLMAMPGLVTTGEELTPMFNETIRMDPVLEVDFLSNGVRPVLGMVTIPYDLYTTGKEIRVPEDLKGLKIMNHGGVFKTAIEHLGATPVTITVSDMYEAFDKGVVDVINHYPSTLNAWSMGDLIESGTSGAKIGAAPYGLMISEKTWQGLPENARTALYQAGDELAASSSKIFDDDSKSVEKKWIEQGQVNKLTDEELKKWEKVHDEIREKWLAKQKDPKYKEAYDLVMKKIQEIK
ncbi:TRAP transporter substrate-binding protein DctP [Mammaliicoccus sciuri]|uniref:TRAP-type C4-dicarboxylate transport system, substrate-binding protein n=1 Tax=Sporosarcina newyorkensis TaxID=759851 RepID=A0A1T4Y0J6_9BACL|nr:TRAP transporter substrate-binding protein DctP [Sporosarcina newyorkensis]SKA94801.1 TRAP-type C4-dicarboxylate transport system, substrate-binding protein [Sporosarcina newyorkensis]